MNRMPQALWDVWEAGQFVGDDRPMCRATISRLSLHRIGELPYRSLLFADPNNEMEPQFNNPIEIPNIKVVNINRRLGQDSATMTMTILNNVTPSASDNLDETHGASSGPTRRELQDLGTPGAYSFGRGENFLGAENVSADRWGHAADPTWVDLLIPNRVISTFQGYGTDGAARPFDDTKLVQTGTWLIDSVNFAANGLITINCRDAVKLLIEQRLYPPIVPQAKYPLEFCADHEIVVETAPGPGEIEDTVIEEPGALTITSKDLGFHPPQVEGEVVYDSSVAPWRGYDASYYGHKASDAFDGDETTYWLSVGNSSPTASYAYEWIDAACAGQPINMVRFKPKWGGYLVYVSVYEKGSWRGSEVIPYNPGSVGKNGANIPYVKKKKIAVGEDWVGIQLDRIYAADLVRLTFYDLHNTQGIFPSPYYRAAIYEMQVKLRKFIQQPPIVVDPLEDDITEFIPGNLTNNDYTDIIKLLCAWSGFYWPHGSEKDQLLEDWADGADIGTGRVWGDFMYSGAWPVDPPCIPPSFWDNKSVMDGINQIKEILGFIFYSDPSGGVVWRPPNIWSAGNYISGTGYVGADSIPEIDETQVLLDYGVTINDENLRSEIIVVSSEDPSLYGSFSPGHTSSGEQMISTPSATHDLQLLGGQQRIMLVPNYPFVDFAEVEKFAFLVSLWTHWSYRKSKFRIPGNPALEPDDQVRIFERVTSESYVHYLLGVNSTMDLDNGSYTMDIDTHWLGNGPGDRWVVDFREMSPALYAYLKAIGQISDDVAEGDLPPEFFDPNLVPVITIDPPRVDDDYMELFPELPTIVFPPGEFPTEDPSDPWITDPTGGGGGSAYACTPSIKRAYWGSPCQGIAGTSTYIMTAWNPLLPATDQEQSHSAQTKTVKANLDARTRKAWAALGRLFADEFYVMSGAGGYNCRKISGSDSWSNHAWGHALDVDSGTWPRPPRGTAPARGSDGDYLAWLAARGISTSQWSKLKAVGQKCVLISYISTGNNQRVFRWGGEWTDRDPMHFEVCATPADMATGIKFKGVLL